VLIILKFKNDITTFFSLYSGLAFCICLPLHMQNTKYSVLRIWSSDGRWGLDKEEKTAELNKYVVPEILTLGILRSVNC
jgi:hypothetical protein